jgi:outer membrane immunogenic protein
MIKTLLGSLAIGTFVVAQAMAADMPVKAPLLKAPPPVFTWTGCYLGGYAGGAAGERVRTFDPRSATGAFYNDGNPAAVAPGTGGYRYTTGSSGIGGGTLGCNWAVPASSFVWGIEGESGYMRLTRRAVDPFSLGPVANFNGDTIDTTRIGDWYGAATGRLGWANDRALFYVKGGAGFTGARASVTDICTTAPCGGATLAAVSGSNSRAFWVGGGGVEYAWTDQWSIKAEYLFLGIHQGLNVCGPASTGVTFCSPHTLSGVHTAKVGINYHFNWGGPVTARY